MYQQLRQHRHEINLNFGYLLIYSENSKQCGRMQVQHAHTRVFFPYTYPVEFGRL